MAQAFKPYTNSIGIGRFTNPAYNLTETVCNMGGDLSTGKQCSIRLAVSPAAQATPPNSVEAVNAWRQVLPNDTDPWDTDDLTIDTTLGEFRNLSLQVKGGGAFPAQLFTQSVECV